MSHYLHTCYRITDPAKSQAFYEALGFEFRKKGDIVRNGELEATNYFFGMPGEDAELELTFNHDGRSYELGTGYGHVAIGVEDLDGTLARLKDQGIEPEREPYRVREGGSRLCFVRDPDEYRIETIDGSGRNTPPLRRCSGEPSPASASIRDPLPDQQQHDGADDRGDPGADVEELVDRVPEAEGLCDEARNHRADDPHDR